MMQNFAVGFAGNLQAKRDNEIYHVLKAQRYMRAALIGELHREPVA